jgi:choline dehydrogenase-like flavoprotein
VGSIGRVTLHTAKPEDPPAIDPAFLTDPYDWDKSLEGFRWGREMMRSKAYQPFVIEEYLPSAEVKTDKEIREYVRQWAKTDHHPVGSCKMGDDDLAVVDQELKVRGFGGAASDRRVGHAKVDQRQPDGHLDHDRGERRSPRAARPHST